MAAGGLWRPLACRCIALTYAFIVTLFSLYACLALCPNAPFGERHPPYWIRAHRNDLILTNYIFDNPISKYGHVPRYQAIRTSIYKFGVRGHTIQPTTPSLTRTPLRPAQPSLAAPSSEFSEHFLRSSFSTFGTNVKAMETGSLVSFVHRSVPSTPHIVHTAGAQ